MAKHKQWYIIGGLTLVTTIGFGIPALHYDNQMKKLMRDYPVVVEYLNINNELHARNENIERLKSVGANIDDLVDKIADLEEKKESLSHVPSVNQYLANDHQFSIYGPFATGTFIGFLLSIGGFVRVRYFHP